MNILRDGELDRGPGLLGFPQEKPPEYLSALKYHLPETSLSCAE